jgi:hypothetical protein
LLDVRQHLAQCVDKREQRVGHFKIEGQLAIAERTEQAFAGVRHLFESAQSKKAAAAFDGVNVSENARKQRSRVRSFFERDKVALNLIKVLAAFGKEFS